MDTDRGADGACWQGTRCDEAATVASYAWRHILKKRHIESIDQNLAPRDTLPP